MKILIWGVPCVGKRDVGRLLAEKLNYQFFDMTELVKKEFGTIDNFNDIYINAYNRFEQKRRIALNVINNNDNFVLVVSLIYIEEIVDKIIDTDTISVELIDSTESVYDRILFYDEFDNVIPDSKEYRDAHKDYYMSDVKYNQTVSYDEYINIPKFDLKEREFEDVIEELVDFINELAKKKK